MKAGVPVGRSGRVDPGSADAQADRDIRESKGGDFSTPVRRRNTPAPAPRQRVGRRELHRIEDGLSARDRHVIEFVGEHRVASAAQIRQLAFPVEAFATAETAARTARRVMTRLVRDRLLVRLERRVGGVRAGSDGFIYTLGTVGYRIVARGDRARPRYWEPSSAFVDHHLAVTQIAVDLRIAHSRGEVDVLELQGEPRSWRVIPGQQATAGSLRPDMYLALRVGELEHYWFVEVDRGTAHLPALLRKSRLYDGYYRSGVEQAVHGVFPRVLWITPNEARASRLEGAIAADGGLTEGLFGVTTVDDPIVVLCGAGSTQ